MAASTPFALYAESSAVRITQGPCSSAKDPKDFKDGQASGSASSLPSLVTLSSFLACGDPGGLSQLRPREPVQWDDADVAWSSRVGAGWNPGARSSRLGVSPRLPARSPQLDDLAQRGGGHRAGASARPRRTGRGCVRGRGARFRPVARTAPLGLRGGCGGRSAPADPGGELARLRVPPRRAAGQLDVSGPGLALRGPAGPPRPDRSAGRCRTDSTPRGARPGRCVPARPGDRSGPL